MSENISPYAHQVHLHEGGTPSKNSLSQQEDLPQNVAEVATKEVVLIKNVMVKFRITDTQTQVIVRVYPSQMSIAEVKQDIARRFAVTEGMLSLEQGGRPLCDTCLLQETDSDEFGIREFALALKCPETVCDEDHKFAKLDFNVYYDKCRLPDFITVHIPGEDTTDGNPKDIAVEIQNKAILKPFLCGYRDKATGIEYLDAFTQTGPYFDKWKYRRHFSRDTQTVEHKQKLVDTMHDQISQCFLDDNNAVFVSDYSNYTLVPKKYQTHAQKERFERKLDKIKLIQRNWRRYLAVRYMKNAAKEYRGLVANRIAEEEAFKQSSLERVDRAKRSKQFPRTRNDFDLLYSEVQKWKAAELKRIAGLYEGAARVTEVNLLLDKETQLLNGIDKQRQEVLQKLQDSRHEKLLVEMGEPIKWIGYKDRVIHLDLIRTQRVRYLYDIYKNLKEPIPKEGRVNLLRKVKEIIVEEKEFPDFQKIFDLIERERNLLIYTKHCDVNVLRQRILRLFMEFIKFNKENTSAKIAKRLCSVCHVLKPVELFALRTRQNSVDVCKKCDNLKITFTENTIYTAILRCIQREERKKRCNGSYAFILQVDDIQYIVERIWHSHSILSKNEDLSSLRLPRWIKSEDWSPWNCVCLTESEARDHYKIEELKTVYDHKLILEIDNHHKLARAAFHKLTAVATTFVEVGQWWRVGMNKQREIKFIGDIEASTTA